MGGVDALHLARKGSHVLHGASAWRLCHFTPRPPFMNPRRSVVGAGVKRRQSALLGRTLPHVQRSEQPSEDKYLIEAASCSVSVVGGSRVSASASGSERAHCNATAALKLAL